MREVNKEILASVVTSMAERLTSKLTDPMAMLAPEPAIAKWIPSLSEEASTDNTRLKCPV